MEINNKKTNMQPDEKWIKCELDYDNAYQDAKEKNIDLINWFDSENMPMPLFDRVNYLNKFIKHFELTEEYEMAGDVKKQIEQLWSGKLIETTGYKFIPQSLKAAAKKIHFVIEYQGAFKSDIVHDYLLKTDPDIAWAAFYMQYVPLIIDYFGLHNSFTDIHPLMRGQIKRLNGLKYVNPPEIAAKILKKAIKIQIKNIII
jgi:hypothetical protein